MGVRTRLARVYYDLSVMLDAGVPVLRSLDIVIEGRQGYFKRILWQIRESLAKGAGLAESMSRHSVFPDLDRMLIEAAETSGSLGESFKMLSEWHEFVHRITRRMMMALIYPVFLLHFAALVSRLPYAVMGKLTVAGYFREVLSILMFLYVPAITVIVFILLRDKVPLLRLPLDWVVLKIPVLGQAVYHLSICRYAKAFAMMYKAGVPIAEVTRRATQATGNVIVAARFAGGEQAVRKGGAAWEGFSKRLPTEYRHLWQIGEETGDLDKTAAKVGEIAGDRADLYFKAFASGFPKVVYFVILIVTAAMVLAIASQFYGNLYNGF